MATVPKWHWTARWRHETKPVKRDPAAEQLHRDRVNALIVVGVSVLILALIVALSVLSGGPPNPEINPWVMP